jgi:hypothetical protein
LLAIIMAIALADVLPGRSGCAAAWDTFWGFMGGVPHNSPCKSR